MWLSLVERHVRDVEVAGSNPVISTNERASARFCVIEALFHNQGEFMSRRNIDMVNGSIFKNIISYTISWGITFIAQTIAYFIIYNKKKKQL